MGLRLNLCIIYFLLALPLLSPGNNESRQAKLTGKIRKATQDTTKIRLYRSLAQHYNPSDTTLSLIYGDSALQIARENNWNNIISGIYNNRGVLFWRLSNFNRALYFYKKSLKIAEGIKDKESMALAMGNMAMILEIQGEINEAIKYYFSTIDLFEEIGNQESRLHLINIKLCELFREEKLYGKAHYYCQQALEISKKKNDSALFGSYYNALGSVYLYEENYDSARIAYLKAKKFLHPVKNKSSYNGTFNNLAIIYFNQNKYDSALYYYQISLRENEKSGKKQFVSQTLGNIANLFLHWQKPEEAIPYALRSYEIANEIEDNYQARRITQLISEIYEELEDYQNSLKYLKLHLAIKDSIFTIDREKAFLEFSNTLELERKEKELQATKNEKQLDRLQNKRKNLIIYVTASGLLFLLIFIFFVFRAKRKREKLNDLLIQKNKKIYLQNEQLEEMNRYKNTIFSTISHDLRSPLASLQGLLSVIEDSEIREKDLKGYLKQVSQKLESTFSLLNSLLFWANTQMKGQPSPREKTDIHLIADEEINYLEKTSRKKNISLHNKIRPGTFSFVDPGMIKVVIRNLVSNAIKFSYPESRIEIVSETENDQIVISIIDYGVGIEEEKISDIFKAGNTSFGTSQEKGSGFGLLLSKELIEKSGGYISVSSAEGKGSRFSIHLPSHEENGTNET